MVVLALSACATTAATERTSATGPGRAGNGTGTATGAAVEPVVHAPPSSLTAPAEQDEAELYIQEVLSPHPTPAAFRQLAKIANELSPERREAIARLGGSAAAPIYVPDIGMEYRWVNTFGCPAERPKITGQALLRGPRGAVDRVTFICGGDRREVFFDFGDDPLEKALKRGADRP